MWFHSGTCGTKPHGAGHVVVIPRTVCAFCQELHERLWASGGQVERLVQWLIPRMRADVQWLVVRGSNWQRLVAIGDQQHQCKLKNTE